jgi:hypothetical protein
MQVRTLRSTTGRAMRSVVVGVGLAGFLALSPLAGAAQAQDTDGQLAAVRIGNDGAFDRVVFEYEGTVAPTAVLIGPRTNPGTVPEDASGMPIAVSGNQILTVNMHIAFASPGYTGPTNITPTGTANVVQAVQTGDFESQLQWTIGLKFATTPTVTVIADPVRVVVDIPHATATPPTTTATVSPAPTVAPVSASPAFTG